MSMRRKVKGYAAERMVGEHYQSLGYCIRRTNFTIRGGEIDLIVEDGQYRCFIEVKVIDCIDDISGYIPYKKLQALRRTIAHFSHKYPTKKGSRIDVVFVEQNRIVHIFENITF